MMIPVIAKKHGKEFLDHVQKEHLVRLIKEGYVVGVPDPMSEDDLKNVSSNHIGFIFDLDKKQVIFKPDKPEK